MSNVGGGKEVGAHSWIWMASLGTALILGVTLFAATNIDDLFVLLGFFADPEF
jgi:hypothetical protein